MAHLLVVEDDEQIGAHLESALRANGYEASWCVTGASALQVARAARSIDLVLLDLGLPDIDGVEICREIRLAQPGAVIVMLTARTDEMDVVAGLESGADDYLTKPFGMVELLARLRAHLRRGGTQPDREGGEGFLDLGDVRIDVRARRCLVGNVDIVLRAKEFDLLVRLAESAGSAVSRETLMADVWDENWWGSTKTLDVHIAALRRKLAEAAAAHDRREPVIATLRGHGYRLESPPAVVQAPLSPEG